MDRPLPGLKERHAATSARDKHGMHSGTPQQQTPRSLERGGVIVDVNPKQLLELRFVRRTSGQTTIVEQPVSGIHQDRDGAPARTARHRRADGIRKRRGDQSRPIVRQQHGVASIDGRRQPLREDAAHFV